VQQVIYCAAPASARRFFTGHMIRASFEEQDEAVNRTRRTGGQGL
jgi:hypothetical protein